MGIFSYIFFFLLDIFWIEIVIHIISSKQSLIGAKKYICKKYIWKKFQLSLYCSSKFLCLKKKLLHIYIYISFPIDQLKIWIFHSNQLEFSIYELLAFRNRFLTIFRSFWIVVAFPTIYCNFQITWTKRVKKKIFTLKKITKILCDLKIE